MGVPSTSHKTSPDTMVKTPFDFIDFNPSNPKFLNNLFGNLSTPLVRILVLVVMCRKAIEIINDIHLLANIDLNLVRAALPVRRKDNDGLGLDLCGDLVSNAGQLGVGRMLCIFDEIGPANTEEVDGCPCRKITVGFGSHGLCRNLQVGKVKFRLENAVGVQLASTDDKRDRETKNKNSKIL